MDIKWLPVHERCLPDVYAPVVFLGYSGYVKPHSIRIISGYRRENYADGSTRLVDTSGEALTASGPQPTHWAFRGEFDLDWLGE